MFTSQIYIRNFVFIANYICLAELITQRVIGNTLCDKFSQTIGVRQGCPLSPCLFNLFLEEIMTDTIENFEGTVSAGGRKITNLRFADDMDLIAGSRHELANLIARLDEATTSYSMEISAEKSKVHSMMLQVTGYTGNNIEWNSGCGKCLQIYWCHNHQRL